MTLDRAFANERIRHHFVGREGHEVYAKEVHLDAGEVLVSHRHPFDHLSILSAGLARLTVNGESRALFGTQTVLIRAGEEHVLEAVTPCIWFCIHATTATDPDTVDEIILAGGD